MNKNLLFVLLSIFIVMSLGSCHRDTGPQSAHNENHQDTVLLTFRIELNQRVYEDSTWGDPPQLAVWLLNRDDSSIRTVLVTYRTAACDWLGKVECSVALPYWVSFYNKQTATYGPPKWDSPIPDAVTCATPKTSLTTTVEVPCASCWQYFVEVNVSGDFNAAFANFSDKDFTDRYGNGQPSLVYSGFIEANEGSASRPELIGRTDQYEPVDKLITNIEGVTSAKDLLKAVSVSCKEKG